LAADKGRATLETFLARFGHALRALLLAGAVFLVPACGGGPSGRTVYIGPVPTPTPTPVVTDVFVATSAGLIEELSPVDGSVIATFAKGFGATAIAMDAAGDVFAVSGLAGDELADFAIGASSPTATYAVGSPGALKILVTPQGELVAESLTANVETVDEWQPGNTGTPDVTLSFAAQTIPAFVTPAAGSDGTLYVAYEAGPNVSYGVYPPGAATPARTIVEPRGSAFVPTSMAVGTDGTLYVTEWDGHTNDPFAGLYVYSSTGTERYVHVGAPAPVVVKVDAFGNVYVLNDNATSTTADTVHLFTEFDPATLTSTRRITAGFANGSALTVDPPTGLIYIVEAASSHATGAVVQIVPGAISATPFAFVDATSLVLYDGTRAIQAGPRKR
jgi:hypothetical protein